MRSRRNPTAWFFIAVTIFSIFWSGCAEESPSIRPGGIIRHGETFTFFGVGINSSLSKDLIGELTQILGSDAIQHKNSIDLEINYPGFLKRYFPHLDQMNQRLNFPPRERVEHNTSKLTYRYAREKNLAFDYVEFLFSDYNKTPLLVKIHFKTDDMDSLGTLKDKYGAPDHITWERGNGKSFFWERSSDSLIFSTVPDQFGNPAYQIVIFFTKRLEELLIAEDAEKREKRRQTVPEKKPF